MDAAELIVVQSDRAPCKANTVSKGTVKWPTLLQSGCLRVLPIFVALLSDHQKFGDGQIKNGDSIHPRSKWKQSESKGWH